MPSKRSAKDRAAEQADFKTWLADAVAELQRQHSINPAIIPQRIWRHQYIKGRSPQDAAATCCRSRSCDPTAATRFSSAPLKHADCSRPGPYGHCQPFSHNQMPNANATTMMKAQANSERLSGFIPRSPLDRLDN
jgi:hypothetical protein